MRRLALLAVIVGLAGCGTAVRRGHVGDTLKAGSITATLGSWKADGKGRMRVCNKRGQAIFSWLFTLKLSSGQIVHADTVSSTFDLDSPGCGGGSLVFILPQGTTAKRLELRYDDTGSGGQYGKSPEHDRFDWSL